jgi:hypothetical protein
MEFRKGEGLKRLLWKVIDKVVWRELEGND